MCFQSMSTAACCPNPRSCTWIIATREPRLSNICIYWVTGVSLTQTVQWIAACDLICIELQTSKTLPSNHFSHTSVVRVWCWFCLMLGGGLSPYYTVTIALLVEQVWKIFLLCILILKWNKRHNVRGRSANMNGSLFFMNVLCPVGLFFSNKEYSI